jgi:hypothetical protein
VHLFWIKKMGGGGDEKNAILVKGEFLWISIEK